MDKKKTAQKIKAAADMSGKGKPAREIRTGRKGDDNRQMKAVAVGCLAAVIGGMILLCIISLMMSSGKVPIWAVKGIGLAVDCLMAAFAAFVCARRSRQNGFALGLLCAGVLYAVCFLSSVSMGESPGFWALVKLFSMLLCGGIFGSVGVNMKRQH